MRNLLIICVFACFLASCQQQGLITAKDIPPQAPPPTPTPPVFDNDQKAAIAAHLERNRSGWRIEGESSPYGGEIIEMESNIRSLPFNLHVVKKDRDKVLQMRVQSFIKENGHWYWVAFEQRTPPLSKEEWYEPNIDLDEQYYNYDRQYGR